MKKILFLLILASMAFGQYIVTAPGGIVIELDTLDGYFGIGDTVGTTGRRLMYDFNYAWIRQASHFVVMIDSVLYSNDGVFPSICGGVNIRAYRGPISTFYDGFATQWTIPVGTAGGSIILTQRLKAVIIDDAPAVEISYMFLNMDGVMHSVGFMQNIDVLVGTNDVAPMAMNGVFSDIGNIFTGNGVPFFWQAFEHGLEAGSDQVVARGLLRGVATKPDIFAFGHQIHLYMDCWEPNPTVIGRRYYDSGVSMLWEERQISPSKFLEVSTIYGFGEAPDASAHYIVMPLVPNSVGSACDTWAQNPFEVAVLVHNTDLSPGIDSLRVCISLDEGFNIAVDPWHTLTDSCYLFTSSLVPDSTIMLNWLVRADSSYFDFGPTTANIITRVTSTTTAFTSVEETTSVSIPDPGGVPPIVRTLLSPIHAVSCAGVSFHVEYLIQDDRGIDPSSLIFQIGPYLRYRTDTMVTFAGDTARLVIPYFYLYHGNQIYHGVVAVSDSDGCIPDSIPVVGSFWVDLFPPEIGSPYPPDASTIGDSALPVILPLKDWPAGVDTASIRLSVGIDGARTVYSIASPELAYIDSNLVFTLGYPWPDSAEIEVCLTQAWDLTDPSFCPVNTVDTFCFAFRTNLTGIGETVLPLTFDLKARPNPFNSAVTIEAPLASRLEIFDISGRPVRDLSGLLSAERNSAVLWDGKSDSGANLPSGVYFARARCEDKELVTKVALIR